MSLNILLSHSMSLKVIRNDTVEYGVCKSLLVFHWNYICIVPFVGYLASKNGVTLKLEVGVIQGHRKCRRLIDHIRLFICPPLYLVPFLRYLTLKNIVTLKSGFRVHWRSFKLVPFERLGAVSYLPSIVTMAVSLTVYETFSVRE